MNYRIRDSESLPSSLLLKFPRCVCLKQCYDRAIVFGALEHYLLSRHSSLPDKSYLRFNGEQMRREVSQYSVAYVLSGLTLKTIALVLPENLGAAKFCCSHREKRPEKTELEIASWAQYFNIRVVLYAIDCKWKFQPYGIKKGVTVRLWKNTENQYYILHTREWSDALTTSPLPAVSVKETDFSETLSYWRCLKPEGFTEVSECARELSALFTAFTTRLSNLAGSDPLLHSAGSLLALESLKSQFQKDCQRTGGNSQWQQIRLNPAVSCHYCALKIGTQTFECPHLFCEQCQELAKRKYGKCPECLSLPFDPNEVLSADYEQCSFCLKPLDDFRWEYTKCKHILCQPCQNFATIYGFCITCINEGSKACDLCGEHFHIVKYCSEGRLCLNCTRMRVHGDTCSQCGERVPEGLVWLIKRFERYPNAGIGLMRELQPPLPPIDSFPCGGCGEFLSYLDYTGNMHSSLQCPVCETVNTR